MAQLGFVPSEQLVQKKRKLNPRLLVVVAAVAVGGYLSWRQFMPQIPPSVLKVSGRIESDETDIGAKTGGRVTRILVREGDEVKAGQIVVQIEDEEVNQQLQAAAAQVSAVKQEEVQARLDMQIAESHIQEAELSLTQAQEDYQGQVKQAAFNVAATRAQFAQARAQVVQAQAGVKSAESQLKLAKLDRDRYTELASQGAVNRQQFDRAQTNADTAQANLETASATLAAQIAAAETAEKQFQGSQGGLTKAQSTRLNPKLRRNQLLVYQQQKQQSYARVAAAQANVTKVIANQQQIQKRLDSFDVKSPIAGTVQARPLEPGAVVISGTTLLTVLNPNLVYMRAYVPEEDLGKIYVGKSAQVFLDSNPKEPLKAKVSTVDPKASFTPENIYFQKDRVRQVFGVKLAIDQSQNYAKPGMPADAKIDLK